MIHHHVAFTPNIYSKRLLWDYGGYQSVREAITRKVTISLLPEVSITASW